MNLDDDNFTLYAAKHYSNIQCFSDSEFYSDLKRIRFIKRIFDKYDEVTDRHKERVILNHIIVLYNLFGPECSTRLLFFKLHNHLSLLKPYLEFLNYLPDFVNGIGFPAQDYDTSQILSNSEVKERLCQI